METVGRLKVVNQTEQVSEKFKKREFVITIEPDSKYPQHVSFLLTQDNCDKIDAYKVGTDIQVQFNLKGREWNGPQGVKYFNTLEAWRIVNLAAEHHTAKNDNDDLPF